MRIPVFFCRWELPKSFCGGEKPFLSRGVLLSNSVSAVTIFVQRGLPLFPSENAAAPLYYSGRSECACACCCNALPQREMQPKRGVAPRKTTRGGCVRGTHHISRQKRATQRRPIQRSCERMRANGRACAHAIAQQHGSGSEMDVGVRERAISFVRPFDKCTESGSRPRPPRSPLVRHPRAAVWL